MCKQLHMHMSLGLAPRVLNFVFVKYAWVGSGVMYFAENNANLSCMSRKQIITKTFPCSIQRFFSPVKNENFIRK